MMCAARFETGSTRRDLRRAIPILRDHGLKRSARYCAELLVGLRPDDDDDDDDVSVDWAVLRADFLTEDAVLPASPPTDPSAMETTTTPPPPPPPGEDEDMCLGSLPHSACEATLSALEAEPVSERMMLALSYFEVGEYLRCAVALTGKETEGGPLPAAKPQASAPSREVFVWAYSLYLAGEKRKEEQIVEAKQSKKEPLARANAVNAHVEPLREVLEARRDAGTLTGLTPYLLGVVLKDVAASRSLGGYEEAVAFLERHAREERRRERHERRLAREAAADDDKATEGEDDDDEEEEEEEYVEPPPYEVQAAKACEVLAESVRLIPWNWSAWLDMAQLSAPSAECRLAAGVATAAATLRRPGRTTTTTGQQQQQHDDDYDDEEEEVVVGSPELVRACYATHVAIEQHRTDEALRLVAELKQIVPGSNFVAAHEALAHYARRDFDAARERFEALREDDPYRLEQLDIYSNVLYVKEDRAELSRVAHAALRTDKYRPETCCVIGNYYSLKRMHEHAVIYFQRALRLDRTCLSAWTLMGHEYIELKNTAAAIEAYRRAVDVNSRDYRAWYGLGQTYEILTMNFYALYYYRKAARLRPYDARMWIAIAQCHEKLHKYDDAIKYYERAASHEDAEGHAALRLAKLHRQRRDDDKAAFWFQHYIDSFPEDADIHESIAEALLYLATRLKQRKQLQAAQAHLVKLLDFAGPEKLEAQAMLREIRALADAQASPAETAAQ